MDKFPLKKILISLGVLSFIGAMFFIYLGYLFITPAKFSSPSFTSTISAIADGETTKTTEDVLTKLERSGVNYPVGKTEIIFKNDSGDVLNPSIENLVSLIDRNQHKVVYDVSNVPLATGPITIYIEKFEGFNAIHICEGADELPKVGPGVCAALGGIPITIFPGGDTKGYTVTSYYDSSIGRDFWKVEGLTGTGYANADIAEVDA